MTAEGRQFVRDWDADPGKTVLDAAWVSRSLSAGRPLLQGDGYGGLGGLDPGDEMEETNVVGDEEDEEDVPSAAK